MQIILKWLLPPCIFWWYLEHKYSAQGLVSLGLRMHLVNILACKQDQADAIVHFAWKGSWSWTSCLCCSFSNFCDIILKAPLSLAPAQLQSNLTTICNLVYLRFVCVCVCKTYFCQTPVQSPDFSLGTRSWLCFPPVTRMITTTTTPTKIYRKEIWHIHYSWAFGWV